MPLTKEKAKENLKKLVDKFDNFAIIKENERHGFIIGESCGNSDKDKYLRNPCKGKLYQHYLEEFKVILKSIGIRREAYRLSYP
jgi:hypothetical protein